MYVNFNRNPFRGLGAAAEPVPTDPTTQSQNVPVVTQSKLTMLPASIAQQIFSIAAGASGGLVGFVLAYKLRNALLVNTTEVALATSVIIAATVGSLFLFRTVVEYPELPSNIVVDVPVVAAVPTNTVVTP